MGMHLLALLHSRLMIEVRLTNLHFLLSCFMTLNFMFLDYFVCGLVYAGFIKTILGWYGDSDIPTT